ncbi:MAG: site-specific DNA-methyltransferase [Cyanobacteria bacterium P01_D01_bin.56]
MKGLSLSIEVLHGDCRQLLRQLPDESINCIVTSPPYWGLRDYGCEKQLGMEPTPDHYTDNLVAVFNEARRVLRSDGTLWLNLGDCYARTSYANSRDNNIVTRGRENIRQTRKGQWKGLPAKSLVGIPWRVALAMQQDGWLLRSDIIWNKPNPTPESVTDRPTRAHEYLFLFTKTGRYYYDADAIREPYVTKYKRANPKGKNKRTVWTIAPQPFKGGHFAAFPPKLVKMCLKAGCPPGGKVLDPFYGAGTTGLVASKLGLKSIGMELNPDYIAISTSRVAQGMADS